MLLHTIPNTTKPAASYTLEARMMDTVESSSYSLAKPSNDNGNGIVDYTTPSSSSPKINSGLKLPGKSNYNSATHPRPLPQADYGGRLQFFKDGKFILELTRSRDGESSGWVSVPRKTFRAPLAATSATVTPTSAVTAYPKNESSASMSFSDDNSSVQSSPWQRDHTWKQSAPRRSISKEMALFYYRPRKITLTEIGLKATSYKRRRPFDKLLKVTNAFQNICDSLNRDTRECEGIDSQKTLTTLNTDFSSAVIPNISEENGSGHLKEKTDCVANVDAGAVMATDKEPNYLSVELLNSNKSNDSKHLIPKVNENGKDHKNNNNTSNMRLEKCPVDCHDDVKNQIKQVENVKSKRVLPRASLTAIIQKLIDRIPVRNENLSKCALSAAPGNGSSVTHKISPPSTIAGATRLVELHQQHVSPRKRILREFEKVSLDDNTLNNGSSPKRSRSKSAVVNMSPNPIPNCKEPSPLATTSASALAKRVVATADAPKSTARLNSSYSIQSILGESSNATSNNKADLPATITSNVPQQQGLSSLSSFYQRTNLNSPRSPESGVKGKRSPANYSTKKRSPPYAVSPTCGADYSRRNSPDNYKQSSHQSHQTFYPPYAITSQYSLPASGPIMPAASTNRQQSPSSTTPRSSHSAHTAATSDDLSPPRSSTTSPCVSPATPRTLPKKTASIRRDFSSPTASSSSAGTNCSSPNERAQTPDRKNCASQYSSIQQHQHSTLLRNSPIAAAGSPLYYMYPTHVNGVPNVPPGASLNGQSAIQSNNNSAAAMAAAMAAAAYIPSVVPPSMYSPYLSTLAALRHPFLLHHYQNVGGSALMSSAGPVPTTGTNSNPSRLPPSFHSFAYNGVNAATMAAAAVAAFGPPSPSTFSQGAASLPLSTTSTVPLTSPSCSSAQRSLVPYAAVDNRTRSKESEQLSALQHKDNNVNANANASSRTSGSHIYNAVDDECSSDVPLNLSKH